MLDLVAVAAQVRRMGAGMAALSQELTPRLAQTLTAWERAVVLGPALRDRVVAAKTSWLVAEPLEPLGAYDIHAVTDYRVIASDGSQILPERHDHMPCFLVNVGVADISYAEGKARLTSVPQVSWTPDEVYPFFGGARQEADARVVGARRFAAECSALSEQIHPSAEPLITLVDGTLLLWWLETGPDRLAGLHPDDVKTTTFEALDTFLRTAKDEGALAGSYLSSPGTRDVVSMLKVVLCTEDPVDCDRCPYVSGAKAWRAQLEIAGASLLPVPDKPCEEADPVTDSRLFWSLLERGQRSPRFRSHATVTAAYEVPIDFVYLHVGAEISRLEFPAWTTPSELETLAGAVLDQCAKGIGYPVALSEAHEQAVVRAPDRRAFIELARRQGVSRPSAKLARKRISVL
ncbi:MAG: DNA double-strand break repair nuclease NurA [Actinomycetota bacterium]